MGPFECLQHLRVVAVNEVIYMHTVSVPFIIVSRLTYHHHKKGQLSLNIPENAAETESSESENNGEEDILQVPLPVVGSRRNEETIFGSENNTNSSRAGIHDRH